MAHFWINSIKYWQDTLWSWTSPRHRSLQQLSSCYKLGHWFGILLSLRVLCTWISQMLCLWMVGNSHISGLVLESLFFILVRIFSILFWDRIPNLQMLTNRIDPKGRTCSEIVEHDWVLYKEDLNLLIAGHHHYRCFHRKADMTLRRDWLVWLKLSEDPHWLDWLEWMSNLDLCFLMLLYDILAFYQQWVNRWEL